MIALRGFLKRVVAPPNVIARRHFKRLGGLPVAGITNATHEGTRIHKQQDINDRTEGEAFLQIPADEQKPLKPQKSSSSNSLVIPVPPG
jgi:hypothetical protein